MPRETLVLCVRPVCPFPLIHPLIFGHLLDIPWQYTDQV